MLRARSWKILSLLLLAACLIATVAIAGEDDDEVIVDKRVEVIVKKVVDCEEGEADCESGRRVVFVGGDGEHHEIDGDHVWVGGHGGLHGRHGHHGHGPHGLHGLKGGFLGVQMTELTPELRAHFGVPEDAGVMVSKVVDDSPASRAGVQVGDVISGVDGETVSSGGALARAIGGHQDGEAVILEVWRDGSLETLTATLEERAGHHRAHAIRVHRHGGHDFDCGGAENCKVMIECDDHGDCDCTVNGEAADCDEIHGE